ncbi:hypothetical protein [Kitasatospora sp. A2-31]|uniref:hypothetical protein n=1 Tax=Kitasatospora sp. A2-31 TaxID=2916414 RepID=UPI001EEF3206|nr:hypothetical protein [Kitasatospora sp. A2-31]MCG6499756.1 hypothetical protein [Kitasatospora sp. A2-31]
MSILNTRKALTVLAAGAALVGATLTVAAPASAATRQVDSRVACATDYYHWCDAVSASGEYAQMNVYWGSDGHEYVDAFLNTSHYGQYLWILTWNGSGWDWAGVPATIDEHNGYWGAVDTGRSDAGKTIKLAVYNWDTGGYLYTNAH